MVLKIMNVERNLDCPRNLVNTNDFSKFFIEKNLLKINGEETDLLRNQTSQISYPEINERLMKCSL